MWGAVHSGKGLAFSYLWYETDMKWQQAGPDETGAAPANVLLGSWILGNFASVEEVRKQIEKVRVFGFYMAKMGMVVPLHAAVQDAAGGSIVIEYNNGKLQVFDNPLGVMTNAPDFPWMVTNARNYIGMSPLNPPAADYAGVKLRPTGHGAGMWGVPGDLTPPSRFVRLAVITHFADQQEDSAKTLNLAQHIVNTFDIAKGMAVDKSPDGKITASETTQWSFFRDLTNKVLYFRTYDNFNLRKIDLKKVDFEGKTAKAVPLYGDVEVIKDITDRVR
jgi:choloylglycine hydrolase